MKSSFVVLIIVGLIILLLVVSIISMINSIRRASIKIEEAASDIDVSLTKRYDVLTKMIEVVKGYAKHEKEVMFTTVELRKNMTLDEMTKANLQMDDNYNKVIAVAEAYPDLKASENFMVLQKAIVDVEEHLQAARRFYNSNVTHYNELIEIFPTNIIAKRYGYNRKDYFKADEEATTYFKIES